MVIGTDQKLTVAESMPYKAKLLVTFEEINDRDAADALRHVDVGVRGCDVGDPPNGQVWVSDIVGREVIDLDGKLLGAVTAVDANPAHDVMVCVDAAGVEFLIPMISEFVDDMSVGGASVTVRPIPGLLPWTGP